MLNDIIKHSIFCQVLSHVYSIEFQKRSLPHAHIIVTLHRMIKWHPETIEKHISAEIPSSENLKLQKLIIKHMLHGPHTEKSPCLDKKQKFM